MQLAKLSPTIDCKVCGYPAEYFGAIDFSRSCEGSPLPPSGVPIPYHRCTNCQFLFSGAFDDWSNEDFSREIYNEDYVLVDPEFPSIRPLASAQSMAGLLDSRKGSIRLLDYGGGNGVFARRMCELGFDTASHDPFYRGRLEPRLGEKFELIHCREVIEHTVDPRGFTLDMLRFLAADGMVYLTTGTQPPDFAAIGLAWRYIAPRNGHISIFSRESLGLLFLEHGLQFVSYNAYFHIAWRGKPACYPCLVNW